MELILEKDANMNRQEKGIALLGHVMDTCQKWKHYMYVGAHHWAATPCGTM